jgi:AraC-like DNA-binding protein
MARRNCRPPHIGKALQLIHERPGQPWTLRELGRSAGLGRAAFAARFTRLVGQPVHRYLVARRMDEAALMPESSDAAIARIATRVGYETTTAFSKMFRLYHGLSPGRYRARKGTSWKVTLCSVAQASYKSTSTSVRRTRPARATGSLLRKPGRDICKLSPQLKFGLDALY